MYENVLYIYTVGYMIFTSVTSHFHFVLSEHGQFAGQGFHFVDGLVTREDVGSDHFAPQLRIDVERIGDVLWSGQLEREVCRVEYSVLPYIAVYRNN